MFLSYTCIYVYTYICIYLYTCLSTRQADGQQCSWNRPGMRSTQKNELDLKHVYSMLSKLVSDSAPLFAWKSSWRCRIACKFWKYSINMLQIRLVLLHWPHPRSTFLLVVVSSPCCIAEHKGCKTETHTHTHAYTYTRNSEHTSRTRLYNSNAGRGVQSRRRAQGLSARERHIKRERERDEERERQLWAHLQNYTMASRVSAELKGYRTKSLDAQRRSSPLWAQPENKTPKLNYTSQLQNSNTGRGVASRHRAQAGERDR